MQGRQLDKKQHICRNPCTRLCRYLCSESLFSALNQPLFHLFMCKAKMIPALVKLFESINQTHKVWSKITTWRPDIRSSRQSVTTICSFLRASLFHRVVRHRGVRFMHYSQDSGDFHCTRRPFWVNLNQQAYRLKCFDDCGETWRAR